MSETKQELINEIRQLREKIERLEIEVKQGNTVLFNHIQFINSVYNNIKKPLEYIMNKVNSLLIKNE